MAGLSKKEISYESLQTALDRYLENRKSKISAVLEDRLSLKDCFEIQKKYFLKDLIRNPVNALWAIPAISIRKSLEIADKLGWETAKSILPKIPHAFKTDFQKEVERILAAELFGLSHEHRISSELAIELEKEASLRKVFTADEWNTLLADAEKEIRSEIHEQSLKHTSFTDLIASGAVLLIADVSFGDRSLDIFGLGRKIASLWARKDAESGFFLGKSLGKAFYSVAPPPPPTTSQVILATSLAIFALALFSTSISVLSYPVQKKLGFRQKQMEKLVDNVGDKLLLRLHKSLKKAKSLHQTG